MLKERPILFNADMVRALLDGRKTQTRRVIKPQPEFSERSGFNWKGYAYGIGADHTETQRNFAKHHCPYGKPGDRLWVREGIMQSKRSTTLPCGECESYWTTDKAEYLADIPEPQQRFLDPEEYGSPWMMRRPSIHMPRWASRITLEIVSVRVERLKDISDKDAQAEGVRFTDFGMFTPKGAASTDLGETWHPFKPVQHSGYHVGNVSKPSECHVSARGAFAGLWAAINGADSWNANRWVWVVEFKRVEASQ